MSENIPWDYTCFECGGRGSPNHDGKGHQRDCFIVIREKLNQLKGRFK